MNIRVLKNRTEVSAVIRESRFITFNQFDSQVQCTNQHEIFCLREYIFGNEKSNLKLSLGVNAKVFSSYTLPGYSSELNQFTISNERTQSSYFMVDFLAKTQIKSVTVFLMITHLNSGLTGFAYFSAFHFPIADRCLKFGLRWIFLD